MCDSYKQAGLAAEDALDAAAQLSALQLDAPAQQQPHGAGMAAGRAAGQMPATPSGWEVGGSANAGRVALAAGRVRALTEAQDQAISGAQAAAGKLKELAEAASWGVRAARAVGRARAAAAQRDAAVQAAAEAERQLIEARATIGAVEAQAKDLDGAAVAVQATSPVRRFVGSGAPGGPRPGAGRREGSVEGPDVDAQVQRVLALRQRCGSQAARLSR